MTCWQCGASYPPDVGFCRACGAFVRPRNAPVNGPGATTAGALQVPVVAPPASGSSPRSSASWPAASAATWTPQSSMARSGIPSSASGPNSVVGDVVAAAGTGLVLISTFLTWYSVTLTSLGVQFYESLERALFSRLFPQIAAGLGGLTGPLTFSVSVLGKGAGGWRWAILVESIVLLLEVIVAISSGTTGQASPGWPHAAVLLILTIASLVLVVAAFFSPPYGGTAAGYLTVGHGIGAYLGLLGGLVACGGAVAGLVKSSPGADTH